MKGKNIMERHPPWLAIMWPMWKVEGCRSVLHGMDDGLFVHQHADGRFELQHRPMYRFVSRGRNSALGTLTALASNLEAGYHFVIVDDQRFLRDLTALAKARTSQDARNDIEWALEVIGERASRQITDHLFEAPSEYMMGRTLLGMREHRNRKRRGEMTGLNLMGGVVTPRTEQLWHSLRHQWCSPRLEQGGHRAWIRWCMQGRPPIPRGGAS